MCNIHLHNKKTPGENFPVFFVWGLEQVEESGECQGFFIVSKAAI